MTVKTGGCGIFYSIVFIDERYQRFAMREE